MSTDVTTSGPLGPQGAGPEIENEAFIPAESGDNNAVFGIETHGFDFIPEGERNMKLRDLGYFWVGSNAYLFFVTLGASVFALGLNVWQSLLTVLIANLAFLYVAWASIAGVRAGVPTMTLTRAAFGVLGNRFNALLCWLLSVAFEAINTVFGVLAVDALLPVIGWHHPGNAGKIIAIATVFLLSAGIATLGHATMVWIQRIFAVLLMIVLAAVFFDTVGGVDWSAGPKTPLSTGAIIAGIFLGCAIVAGGPLSYLFNASDYPRYLPSRLPSKKLFSTVAYTAGGSALFLCLMGVLLASRTNMSNPVTGVQSLIPEWMFIIFGIAAVGGAVANNVMTFYASGLVVQSLGIPIRRYRATMIDTAVATCLVIYIVFISTSFTNDINDVLALMIVWIAPFAGVWLVDGTMRGWSYDTSALHATRAPSGKYWGWKGINRTGFIAMAAGMVVCALTINSTVYQGPISRALDGADLSWLLGLPVSGLVYYVLARPSLRTGNSPTAAPEHDATPVTARY